MFDVSEFATQSHLDSFSRQAGLGSSSQFGVLHIPPYSHQPAFQSLYKISPRPPVKFMLTGLRPRCEGTEFELAAHAGSNTLPLRPRARARVAHCISALELPSCVSRQRARIYSGAGDVRMDVGSRCLDR